MTPKRSIPKGFFEAEDFEGIRLDLDFDGDRNGLILVRADAEKIIGIANAILKDWLVQQVDSFTTEECKKLLKPLLGEGDVE